MKLEPGMMIRDFEIIRFLGEGGIGEVWLANEAILDRQVAIKRLNPIYTQDPDFILRFRNEARIQAQLTHENIVGLISFFNEDNVHYIVMQFAPGITLKELIEKTGPIPERRSLHILRQTLSALQHAHSKGIVHRDMKPSNIMIDLNNDDRVQIMDFGIARLMYEAHITRTGTKMGTLFYMSPEQVLAQKDVDHRSDIYSLGVVLYEMLCGQVAYNIDTNSDFLVQKAIVDTPIPDPRKVYEHISQSTVNLVQAMTHKNRDHRISASKILEKMEYIRQDMGTASNTTEPFTWFEKAQHQGSNSNINDKSDYHGHIDEVIKHTNKIPFILFISTLVFYFISFILLFEKYNSYTDERFLSLGTYEDPYLWILFILPPIIDILISVNKKLKLTHTIRLRVSIVLYWISSLLSYLFVSTLSSASFGLSNPFLLFLILSQATARILEKFIIQKKINLLENHQTKQQITNLNTLFKTLLIVSIGLFLLFVVLIVVEVDFRTFSRSYY